ncbi:MAG: DEAD/DEAH box helicase, partial [Faecalibacterium prausnitzii]
QNNQNENRSCSRRNDRGEQRNARPAAQSNNARPARNERGSAGNQNRAPKAEPARRGRNAAARDEDPGLMLISRRPPQQKYTSFEEYMDAHGGATAPIEDHSEEV